MAKKESSIKSFVLRVELSNGLQMNSAVPTVSFSG